jgi:hypothetical protein
MAPSGLLSETHTLSMGAGSLVMRKGARNGCKMAAPIRTGCSGSGFILPLLGRVGSCLSFFFFLESILQPPAP